MSRTLDAIFFDVDDTLLATSRFAHRARVAAVRAMGDAGLAVPPDVLLAELEEVVREFSSNYGHHLDKLLLRVPSNSYAGRNPALIVAAGVVAYHQTKFAELAAYPGARLLLEALASRAEALGGARPLVRGIITAGRTIKQAEKLIRIGVTDLLTPTAIYISEQQGVSKPNPKLYERACREHQLDPTRVMMVGDNPENDIVPPASLGMVTVRMRSCGRHADRESPVEPDFCVASFKELGRVLEAEFGLPTALAGVDSLEGA